MKILRIIASMDPRSGGPCQGIRNLSPPIAELGHAVEVVCLDDPHAEYLKAEALTIHALGQSRGSWAYHPALIPWLEKNLPRFDAVILHGLWQYPGYALSQLARKLGDQMPPYFVYPHGMLDPWFQRAPGRRLKAVRNWFYWKLIERHVIARATAVLFTCAEEMRLARDTFRPYQPQQEINVGYGISEPPAFHERMVTAFAEKYPGLAGRPYFLYLSRIHPKKGVDIMIQAYARVYGGRDAENRRESENRRSENGGQRSGGSSDLPPPTSDHPTINHQPPQRSTAETIPALVIAGPGLDTDYGREMLRLAASIEPPASSRETHPPSATRHHRPQIFFPGMLTGDAKWGALYRADAFVLTSHQENFGIAVVEALACASPVLISNQINIWREIEQEQAGLVAPDTLAGAEQLFRRWEGLTYEARVAMTRAAQTSYLTRFGVANAAQNLLATMEALVAAPKK